LYIIVLLTCLLNSYINCSSGILNETLNCVLLSNGITTATSIQWLFIQDNLGKPAPQR